MPEEKIDSLNERIDLLLSLHVKSESKIKKALPIMNLITGGGIIGLMAFFNGMFIEKVDVSVAKSFNKPIVIEQLDIAVDKSIYKTGLTVQVKKNTIQLKNSLIASISKQVSKIENDKSDIKVQDIEYCINTWATMDHKEPSINIQIDKLKQFMLLHN